MTKSIPLTLNKFAIVDDEDYEKLMLQKWHARKMPNGKYYAMGSDNISMARFIMITPCGMDTDHISGNTLDNRRCNLRICTRQQNQINRGKQKNNTSGYKGVFYNGTKWVAIIQIDRKKVYLGQYETPKDAAIAYNKFALEKFGDFAKINKVQE